jgi:5'-3' exonuclease
MGAEVVVVSSDKDLWSLLSHPNVSVFSTSQKVWVEPEQIEKAFGLKDPKFITLHKSLWGDTSDSIPNAVPRMQKALIPVIETTDGTLKSFWMKAQEATLSPRCLELLWGNAAQVDKNYALVKLCEDSVVPVEA